MSDNNLSNNSGKLKCPFCQQELDFDDLLGSCINEHCEESFDMVGTELLWQKVIDLKQELIRTRKALDVAVNALKEIGFGGVREISDENIRITNIATNTLEQINEIKGNK